MEFIASKEDLVRELGLIQGIVERKNTIPILSNVLIQTEGTGVEMAATDLDVGFEVPLSGRGQEGGRPDPLGEKAIRDRAGGRRPPD